jgi:hypothetical protein
MVVERDVVHPAGERAAVVPAVFFFLHVSGHGIELNIKHRREFSGHADADNVLESSLGLY